MIFFSSVRSHERGKQRSRSVLGRKEKKKKKREVELPLAFEGDLPPESSFPSTSTPSSYKHSPFDPLPPPTSSSASLAWTPALPTALELSYTKHPAPFLLPFLPSFPSSAMIPTRKLSLQLMGQNLRDNCHMWVSTPLFLLLSCCRDHSFPKEDEDAGKEKEGNLKLTFRLPLPLPFPSLPSFLPSPLSLSSPTTPSSSSPSNNSSVSAPSKALSSSPDFPSPTSPKSKISPNLKSPP